jgi:adenylate kinase family enzyme
MLARRLAQGAALPVIHIDALEFNSDLTKKPIAEIRDRVKKATEQAQWILDGHGPLDLLPMHLKAADLIVFLDFPLYLNLYWLVKRQLQILIRPRKEMPVGTKEWNWSHFKKMYQTLVKQHRLMNPELLRILQKPENRDRVVHVKNPREARAFSLSI